MNALRSAWTWFATSLLILLWFPFLAVIRLSDRDPARYRTGRWFRRLGAAMTRVNPSWKVETEGKDRIRDPRRPYVVVSNHQSNADIPVISRLPWEMKWVGKRELFKVPVVGWMMRLAGDIAVDRKDNRSGAMALLKAKEYLGKRCSVIFFPEGTRSKDGRVLRFTDGAFRLAIKEGVPILPLAIEGTANALPKHTWKFGAPSTIRLAVLPPVETKGLKPSDTEALREQVRMLIAEQIASWRGVSIEHVLAPAPSREETAKREPGAA